MSKSKSLARNILTVFLACSMSYCSKPQPLIVLMTDFGERDFYIGAIKGAIYKVNPHARIDYISNDIAKFDIEEGAYTLLKASAEFPPGTIFVVVVDPGVGTERKPIILKTTNGYYFVGPDNGIFSSVIDEFGLAAIYEISNPDVMQNQKMSSTFHGRDIFGPAAGHLSQGFPLAKFGRPLKTYIRLAREDARIVNDKIIGKVVVIDDYGNLISNIGRQHFEKVGWQIGDTLRVIVGADEFLVKYVNAYGDVAVGTTLGLFGSGDVFEVAIN
ncbi:MAG: S-adenosyl-l-methionine hydroxide adenosyltransferase family protein, partial [bacterium]